VGKARSNLRELTIRNLGVIEGAEVEFNDGLTVLTGETGAGKTMVLTALNLILGNKGDADLVRSGAERLQVTGKFVVSEEMSTEVEELGGEIENNELLISRTVNSDGKSKAVLGGAPSTLGAISTLSESLVEIHAQSSTARLAKSANQRQLLDGFSEYLEEQKNYEKIYQEYRALLAKISELEKQLKARDAEIEKIEEFVKDFAKTSPQVGELEDLENEISRLGSVEAINTALTVALSALTDDEGSATNAFSLAKKNLETVVGRDRDLDSYIDSFKEIALNFADVSADLGRYLSKLEADPKRFDYLQGRKAEINSLIKKYGVGNSKEEALAKLIDDGKSAKERLADLRGGESRLFEMQDEASKSFKTLQAAAKILFEKRSASAQKISELVTSELSALSMPKATFRIEVSVNDLNSFTNYSISGCDEIEFLFTSHAGGKMLPISKAASGGELSRVMLGLEVVLAANSEIGTYIFDEVDAGVGGKAAVEVGRRLAKLAKNAQVIVVTHLAQVAVWADQHLVVEKNTNGSVSVSGVKSVTGEGRIVEIARLLSGQEESKSAREHAEELLSLVAKER
jgi:DNA repair protein RecN (Recombination protein N)